MRKVVREFDTDISRKIYNLQPPNEVVELSVDLITRVFGSLPALLIALLFTKNIQMTVLIFGAIVAINYAFVEKFIKKIFKRKRPTFSGRKHRTFSFPSTHSATMGMITGHFIILQSMYNYPTTALVAFLIYAFFVIMSRIIYGYHFFLDVWAGFILGLILSLPLLLIRI